MADETKLLKTGYEERIEGKKDRQNEGASWKRAQGGYGRGLVQVKGRRPPSPQAAPFPLVGHKSPPTSIGSSSREYDATPHRPV